jgi:hypothetical protein
MEDTLRLHDHRPGTLTGLGRFLRDRTGGMIGSLSRAIRGAAIDVILTDAEKVTKKIPGGGSFAGTAGIRCTAGSVAGRLRQVRSNSGGRPAGWERLSP